MTVLLRCLTLSVLTLLALNLRAAESSPASAVASWKFDSDTAGWKAVTDCTLSVKNGLLIIDGTGKDPHLAAAASGPAGWKVLKLQARFRGRLDGQLFWSEAGRDGFAEERSVRFETRGDGDKLQSVRIFFRPDKELTGLRLDPHNARCHIEVASIELLNEAPPAPQATPADTIRMAKDFRIELLYSVPGEQGSWVNLCVDPKGRLITSDQYGRLYRLSVIGAGASQPVLVEPIDVDLGMAQGLCWAFDSLYVVVNGAGGRQSGFYRVRDTNGDDKLDDVKLLRKFEGSSEHGPHAVILAPDGKSLYICAGNHTKIPDPEESRLPRVWDEDQLLPRMWDAGGHAVGILAPGGWIAKTDSDGQSFELISAGFRNEYDIAFNRDGELFTYDADMEWDIGSPWYRPTRVNHAVSGGEFGWRSGTGKWPDYYPDSLGAVVNIGPGSPTGIAFGYGAKFPAKYQQALFISDWSYGVLYAVHLTPQGASYVGEAERFASGVPLQLTDVVINPHDGAMYFTIGGRKTQSGLYRVTYAGAESTATADTATDEFAALRQLRKELESLHRPGVTGKLDFLWKHLGHPDRHIRFAARTAVEFLPAEQWQHEAFAETRPDALIAASIALARTAPKTVQPKLIAALGRLEWTKLSASQQLDLLRAYALTFIRHGAPSAEDRATVLQRIDRLYPAQSEPLNRELCALLVYLDAPQVIDRTLALLAKAPTQEEQTHYLFCLRVQKSGWSMAQHEAYFDWFVKAAGHRGGHSFSGFLKNIRQEAIDRLSDSEKKSLEAVLARVPNPEAAPVIETRQVVKQWTIEELLPVVQTKKTGRSYERGRQMFAQAACFKCHRFAGQGGIVGPDLSGVGRRFNDLNLLESLIDPSKVISDQYEATTFILDNGKSVTGRIINLVNDNYLVSQNMLDPGNLTPVNRNEIEEMFPAKASMMPKGLIDTLTEEEILDLIAYLRSGGDPGHDVFR